MNDIWILDFGAVMTLAATIIIVIMLALIFYRKKYGIGIDLLAKDDLPLTILNLTLLLAAFIALWLALRVAGLALYNYIRTDSYSQYEILSLISYVLIANLSFTLIKNLAKANLSQIKGIASAAIQALLISFIVLIPRYGDLNFLDNLQIRLTGVTTYLIIAITIVGILIALSFAYRFIPETDGTNEPEAS